MKYSALFCALAAVRLIKTIRKKNPSVQLLLFSATYNDRIKTFAMRIAPHANQVRHYRHAELRPH